MKSIVRTITVLVVVNLLVAGFGLAEKASENAAVLNAELTAGFETTPVDVETKLFAEPVAGLNVSDASYFAMAKKYGGNETVLVIPTDQMKPDDLVAIIEDMSIMSRIFDKKAILVSPPSVPILGEIPIIGYLFSRSGRATEGIYLQGFGAMFFMGVNFPLLPPLEVKNQKTEEDVDPVWAQTKREMYTQEEGKRIVGIETIHNGETILLGGMVAGYDAEKVDEFKRAVTKTLKHAANIRNLKSDEWIVVTVTGASQPVVIEQKVEQAGKGGNRIIRITPHVSKTRSCSTVLTLRVKKSYIDSYSNGELDFDKFRQKIVIFTYPCSSGAAGSESSRLSQGLPSP